MDIKNRGDIKQDAARALEGSGESAKRIILIYGGVLTGVTLLLSLVNFILGRQIGNAEGLSTMSLRTMLETIRTVLQFASTLLLPFWEVGLAYVAMGFIRRMGPEPQDLLHGFRRFGSVFLLLMIQGLLISTIGMVAMQAAGILFMSSPMADSLREILLPLATGGTAPDAETLKLLLGKMIPMVLLSAVVFLAAIAPLFYRFRLARYLVVDEPKMGAMAALMASWQLMKGKCMDMFRLDLSLWWYYLAQLVLLAVCYGDTLLGLMGVKLPMAADAAYFLFYLLYVALQFGLIVLVRLRVETTYAGAYVRLRDEIASV